MSAPSPATDATPPPATAAAAPGSAHTAAPPAAAPARPGRWTHAAERGSVWGMRLTLWVYKLLGRRATGVFIIPIVFYFWATDRRGRAASLGYLRRLYATPRGREALRTQPGLRHSFRHYLEFATCILDRLCFFAGRLEGFRADFEGLHHLKALRAQGRGVLLIGAHLGSFDALRISAENDGIKVHALMYTHHAQRINRIFRELNGGKELPTIHLEPGSIDPVFEAKACLDRGEMVAVLGDRAEVSDRGRGGRARFLGAEMALPRGPLVLAALCECPVVLIFGFRVGPGSYRLIAEPFAEKVELPRKGRQEAIAALAQRYADRLEHYAAEHPYQWFNFYDVWAA